MRDPFRGEPDPFEVSVTATVVEFRNESWNLTATIENGTGLEGGEVHVRVTDSAKSAYGIGACLAEFERFLNATLRPEFRLGAALAMGEQGVFTIVTTSERAPRVLPPALPSTGELAA